MKAKDGEKEMGRRTREVIDDLQHEIVKVFDRIEAQVDKIKREIEEEEDDRAASVGGGG